MSPIPSTPANDSDNSKAKPKKLPWWIYFVDITDAVPPLLFMAAMVLWNKSDSAKAFYAELFKNFPGKEELADQMLNVITGDVVLKWFWGTSAAFALLDLFQWPKFLYAYRIQSKPPPTASYFFKIAVMNFLSSLFIMGPVSKYVMYPIWQWRGGMENLKTIPTAWQSVKEFLIMEAWFEFWLYTSHRIMHLPALYKLTHKRHHVHHNPFTVANFYSTPFEQIFQNNLSGLGALLLPAHPSTMWFFSAYRYLETATSHSGYAIPFSTNAIFHNYHHRMFEGNYGIHAGIPFMDLICGTSHEYFQWRYKYAMTHHWLTNRPIKDAASDVVKELDVEGVDLGGA
ncbi:hypothetical protein M427DRAFT_152910 [Gonapodya prolifera JEL478]|uniref:Fatty acid hydroxylase domain-containing protein n=1 Tax=Gonapodya prolifera (strain JEL478) TaxID=1344416 RepID=A0A139AR41_GONPJ|nr:hypothetical protein M427DRAFT_152910 [Gonapodya prolifera JEL478]|eukprot:KXS18965.1 hypothetical protein M427DRAFT_152910 [Gonapodya prolifera JEL478]